MPASDVEVEATFTQAVTYTLTYDKNTDDSVTRMPENVSGIVAGTEVTLSTATPVREGYDFYGWALSASSEVEVTKVTMDSDITVYAIWLAKDQYTVTFSVNGTTTSKTYYEGDTIAEGDVPTVEAVDGFAFLGWYTGEYDGETAPTYVTPTGATVNKSITYYAVYGELGEGGSGSGDTFTLTDTLTDGDYMFGAINSGNVAALNSTTTSGWHKFKYFTPVDGVITNTESEYIWTLTNLTDGGFTLQNKDTGEYLYLKTSAGSGSVTTQTDPATVYALAQDGSAFKLYPTSSMSGNQMAFNASSGGYRVYASSTGLTKEIYFYKNGGSSYVAYTTSPVTAPSHEVTWYNADGTVFKTTSVKETASIVAPIDEPTKDDEGETYFTFVGWAATADATEALTDLGTMGTEDKAFYPVFTSAEYAFAATVSGKDTVRAERTITLTSELTVTPEKDVSAYTASWTSDTPSVATVDANGKVTGVAAGTAVITVTYTNADGNTVATATKTVTVTESTTAAGGYTLITQDNAPTDFSGEYIFMARSSGALTDLNNYYLFTPSENGSLNDARTSSSKVNIDEGTFYNQITEETNTITMESTGDCKAPDGYDIYDRITEIPDGYAFVIELVDDINGYYTIHVKNTQYYFANTNVTNSGGNTMVAEITNTTELDTKFLWKIRWATADDGLVTTDGYTPDILLIESVESLESDSGFSRAILYNQQAGRFRVYGAGAYHHSDNSLGGTENGSQVYSIYLFGNPNPFKAQIYYGGDQITIADPGTVPEGRESIDLTSALLPDINEEPNWSQVGNPVWSIISKSESTISIDPATGTLSFGSATNEDFVIVQVTYQVHDDINNQTYDVSAQAKVVVVGTAATYSTVIYETVSGADTETQYTVYKTDSTTNVLPLSAYVVNDKTGDNSKTGDFVADGTNAVWSVVNNTAGTGSATINASTGELDYSNITKDAILTVTVTGYTGDGTAASDATYKVYVKVMSYSAEITHDNGTTGDFTVPYGTTNYPLDYLVKNNAGSTTGFTVDNSNSKWMTSTGSNAKIVRNDDGTATLDVSECEAGTTFTVYLVGMNATDLESNQTGTVPRTSVKITVGEKTTTVTLKDDVVVLDFDRPVTIDVLKNDTLNGLTVTALSVDPADGFTVNDDFTLTFTPDGMIDEELVVTYTLTLSDGSTASAKLTLKPAAAVYYEDDNSAFAYTDGSHGKWQVATDGDTIAEQTSSLTSTDIVGYDSNYAVATYAMYSAGSVHMVNVTKEEKYSGYTAKYPTVEFDFAGTGFDVVSVTSVNAGAFKVTVTDENDMHPRS